MKRRKFIILTSQRTGSTVIALWLNNHPHVRCHSEVFLSRYKCPDGMRYFCLNHPIRRWVFHLYVNKIGLMLPVNFFLDRLIEQFLNGLYNNPRHSAPWTDTTNWLDYHPRHNSNQERAVGFKIMYSDLRKLRRLERFFYEENISIMHLIRENLLNSYISLVRRRISGQVHTSGEIRKTQVTLDVKDLMRQIEIKLEQIDVYHHRYKELPYIEVTYEQFLNDLPAFKNQVLDFLEIKAADMAMPPLKRISSGNLHKEITNYDEVEQALSGTPYEKYLLP